MTWLGLIVLDGLVICALIVLLMRSMAGWRLNDLRDALLNRAYQSWSHDGERIPGARQGLLSRLTIRLLSHRDGL